ncbi:lipid-A-disaccharide synthase [Hyphomicrobium sp.]|uniref:lipid-A-disaccharide synthase n=1 Tax=Hyphomicrobium sp. TaxID=82 RepID=UPI000FA31F2A|nr:MAG: lipid-A-disaccharide synthase [Hyphomicrobium sp.]
MQRIGIIAGAGSLPREVATSIVRRGGAVHIIMVDGAGSTLVDFPHTAVNWAQLGRTTAALRQAGIHDILILGGGSRPNFRNARPDFTFFRELPHVLRLLNAGGDDAVLRGLIGVLNRHGFGVVGVGDVAPELLVGEGPLTTANLTGRDTADIERGFSLIAALGRFDIGQAAIVSDGRIEAIEGAEGTDRMLQRVAQDRQARGMRERRGVLVKRPKPGQDLRVDLPAIGPNTVKNADAAGLAGIAVMAGHVLAAEREEMVKLADERGIFIVGIRDQAERGHAAALATKSKLVSLGAVPFASDNERDADRAGGILASLSEFDTGSAVVIDGGRVISVGAADTASEVVARVAGLRGSNKRRKGIIALATGQVLDEGLVQSVSAANLVGIVVASDADVNESVIRAADKMGLSVAARVDASTPRSKELRSGTQPLKIFLVAGEHSGDALGSKLIRGLRQRYHGPIEFAGVGGDDMAQEGFASIFPLEDVAVMGPLSILPKLPRIVKRVYQAVDAAIAFKPDIVVIIDSPEFTHPIAKRIRKRAPNIPIVDYVSPSVWAWRPGRAKKMRPYVDHILALLPFEPDAHARLGGPKCTYVGHPLIEKLDQIQNADAAALAARLKLDPARPVLLVLPGSRTSEVERLIDVFGGAVALVSEKAGPIEVVIPAVRHLRERIAAKTAAWKIRPHIIDSEEKYQAMRLARAALAASGTVTLELALAQTPAVVAYKVDAIMANLRFLLKVPSIVLANLVIGRNVYPEFLQEECTPEILASALQPLIGDTPERAAQLEGLKLAPQNMQLAASNPSEAAADVVLSVLKA